MKCNLKDRENIIAAYISDELSDNEKLSFEEHYFDCPCCFQKLEKVASTVMLIEQDGHNAFVHQNSGFKRILTTPQDFITDLFTIPWRWPQYAASAIVLILLILLPLTYWHFNGNTPGSQNFASNFQKSTAFESLIRQTYQSNLFISDVYPGNEQSFEDEIKFRWRLQDEYKEKVKQIELRIMNNKEKELYSYKTTDNKLDFDESLSPGVYYWALLSDKEMIYLGRFYIRKESASD